MIRCTVSLQIHWGGELCFKEAVHYIQLKASQVLQPSSSRLDSIRELDHPTHLVRASSLSEGEKGPNISGKASSSSPPLQCIRIGVMEDNFVFCHIPHFGQYPKVQLGEVKLHSASD